MLVYVSGPYSGNTPEQTDKNIAAARAVAVQLWEMGHAVICPHTNTINFERDCKATYEQYIEGDLNMISRCDALVMLPTWEASKGALIEHAYAVELAIPIFYYNGTAESLPELHITEVRVPVQVKAFREIIGRMYRVHLHKNAAYSPLNIKGVGEIGVAVRTWDKVCRILNLLGFRIDGEFKGFEPARDVAEEPIIDSWLDLSVYAIIGLLTRQGKWGK